ncbi:LysR family transcriptional regulator [Lacrimispora sp.]|uniref:LysR family transcriptional regulator n=1 Tax=Lacrimispora sp. TaxID=2719234 RepID=UPI002FDAB2B9
MNRYIALEKIIELNSFTKAADALGYTQSAISQMIASLEEELSMKLLYRSRVGAKLTKEGEELYPFIEKMILQYQGLQEKAKEIKGLDTGIIRIGTISSITCHWLPNLMRDFQVMYPNVQFILHQGDYSSIQEWIKTEAVDFGFINPYAVNGIVTHTIKTGTMPVILPQDHPLSSYEVIRLDEIVNDSFILLEEGHYSEPLEAFEACGLKPNIKYTLHDDYAIMTMVEAGLGISILAELVLQRTNYNIAIRPTEPPITRTLAVGYKEKNSLPIASRYFIDYLFANADRLL